MTEEILYFKIIIPTYDMIEGLPTKLNKFLKKEGYQFEIVDSAGFQQ